MKRFLNIPVICSLPYFEQVPDIEGTPKGKISIDGMQFKNLERVGSPYFNVERFSGFVFESQMPLQYSTVLRKDSLYSEMLD